MKKMLLVLCIGMMIGVSADELKVTDTDKKIAEVVCTDKDGVKEIDVGYFICNNGYVGDESSLLVYTKNEIDSMMRAEK